LLSFFYNIQDYAWGNQLRDREKFAVIYSDERLSRREFPSDIALENRIARVRTVLPYLRWQLPTADSLAMETLGVGEPPTLARLAADTFTHRYWELGGELTKPHVPVGGHQLLGWANGIYQQQEDCRLMCELARLGFPNPGHADVALAMEGRHFWRCLLQVNDDLELYHDTWGGGGTLAFMIREDDLRRRDFSRCWCVLSAS
jgi:uncharacterized protein YwqG